jgi:EAL domain-containing protein (putative c-di-GMP-specific phosphodiesterase class I)
VCFFRPELSDIPGRRLRLEQRLRQAIADDALQLHYQPQIAVVDGRITGVEALVRWHDAEYGWVSPTDFVPVAEDSGLIKSLGEWVLHTACRQRAAWRGLVAEDFRLAINLSPRQLEFADLAEQVIAAVEAAQLRPGQIELEITETALMRDPAQAHAFLERLTRHGIKIAMDDFGSGYSSLAYLKRFPIDRLKVDRAFVQDLPHDADDCAIARTVVAMAHALRLRVTAEGVENTAQLEFLAAHGCDTFQGFLCCRPASAVELQELLRAGRWTPPAAQRGLSSGHS